MTEGEFSSVPRLEGAITTVLVAPQDSEIRVVNGEEGVKKEIVLDVHLKSEEGQIEFRVIKVKKGIEDDPF